MPPLSTVSVQDVLGCYEGKADFLRCRRAARANETDDKEKTRQVPGSEIWLTHVDKAGQCRTVLKQLYRLQVGGLYDSFKKLDSCVQHVVGNRTIFDSFESPLGATTMSGI